MHLKLLVHLLQKFHVSGRQIAKLVDYRFWRFRRFEPERFLDNLFLSCDGSNAVYQHDQVYLDGETRKTKHTVKNVLRDSHKRKNGTLPNDGNRGEKSENVRYKIANYANGEVSERIEKREGDKNV